MRLVLPTVSLGACSCSYCISFFSIRDMNLLDKHQYQGHLVGCHGLHFATKEDLR